MFPLCKPHGGGGWPGNLAREYAWDRCPRCHGSMHEPNSLSECLRCWADGGDGRVRHGDRDPRAPMGRSLAKLGRAVLRALEGQPSECQNHRSSMWADSSVCVRWRGAAVTIGPDMFAPPGWAPPPSLRARFVMVDGRWFMPGRVRGRCPTCHGTGHNLRGVLPPVEWPTVVQVAIQEAFAGLDASDEHQVNSWVMRLVDKNPGFIGMTHQTRVVPRGQHRHRGSRALPRDADLDLKISQRLHDTLGGPTGGDRWPRWRRGELRHAEQRRERTRPQWDSMGTDEIHDAMGDLVRAQVAEHADRGCVDPDASPLDVVFDLS